MSEAASGRAIFEEAKPPPRNAELASPLIPELTQLASILIELAQATDDGKKIEHRLGEDPRDRSRADMVDFSHKIAERVGKTPCLLRGLPHPFRTVRHQFDSRHLGLTS